MKIETAEEAINALNNSVPYPNQIRYKEIKSDCIYFLWRGDSFKLEFATGGVDEYDNGLLTSSNISILMRELITRYMVSLTFNTPNKITNSK